MKKFLVLSVLAFTLLGFGVSAHAADLFTYNLYSGMKSDTEVNVLQSLLISHGYLTGTLPTGNFGPLTLAAVKKYQTANNISPTGYVGALTRAALNAIGVSGGTATPEGCTATTMYSPLTGVLCSSGSSSTGITVAGVTVTNLNGSTATLASSYTLPASSYSSVWFEYSMTKDGFAAGTQTKSPPIVLYGSSNIFSVNMTSLLVNTTYYVRAVIQTANGNMVPGPVSSFTTTADTVISLGGSGTSPSTTSGGMSISPLQVSNVTATGANVSSSYQDPSNSYDTVWFEYATDPSAFSGGTASKIGQVIEQGTSNTFTSSLANLTPGVTYYVQAFVSNSGNSALVSSPVISFTTDDSGTGAPVAYQNQSTALTGQALVGTGSASSVGSTGAVLSGVYNGEGTPTSVWFRYWGGNSVVQTTPLTQEGTSSGSVSYVLSNLFPNVQYSYTMVADNSAGIVYGNTATFTTTAE